MEDEETFNRYKDRYGFEGEFNMNVMARPAVSNKYFFNDKEFNTMYIGNVMNIDRNGYVTLVLQEYVPNINTGEVMNKRRNLRNNRFFENGSIVILDNDSLDNVDAYLIPNTNYDSDTSTVGYISDTEDEVDEFEEEFKRRLTFNNTNPSKKSRQQGGKKRKSSKKPKKTSKRRKTHKVKRRKH
jgi:hypothetical protein